MKKLIQWFILAIPILSFYPAARAVEPSETEQLTVQLTLAPGAESLVSPHRNGWGLWSYQKGCSSGPLPKIEILRQPDKGTVEVRPGNFVWYEPDPSPRVNHICDGVTFKGLGVYYRAPAEEGSYSFRFEVWRTQHRSKQPTAADALIHSVVEVQITVTNAAPQGDVKKS